MRPDDKCPKQPGFRAATVRGEPYHVAGRKLIPVARILSFGKAREMAQMTAWAFQQLLGARGIAVHYDVEEYEQDLAVLKELGRL